MRTIDNDGTGNNDGSFSLVGGAAIVGGPISDYFDFRVTSFTKHSEPGMTHMLGFTKPISEGNDIINNSATLEEELQENETIKVSEGTSIKIDHINTKINKKLLLEPDSKVVIVDARLIYENLSNTSITIDLPRDLDDRVNTLGSKDGEIIAFYDIQ
ncbi:hypothetical protein H6P87_00078 [Rickettsia tillamookensis]|uniref:Uncharacterized protein n=1 Tax=Rickettsia tillamookensis TaxID=2761623 RepID=A0A9E6SPW7_9RICK|nr:hypothetical protein [Rickettsia tillamookensis]QQV74544.1 hypothetical protein H6P87_00078 [Rickettsia tillamookensis]